MGERTSGHSYLEVKTQSTLYSSRLNVHILENAGNDNSHKQLNFTVRVDAINRKGLATKICRHLPFI